MKRIKTKSKPSTFWTNKVNPQGASIGNAIYNFKKAGAAIKKALTVKSGVRQSMGRTIKMK